MQKKFGKKLSKNGLCMHDSSNVYPIAKIQTNYANLEIHKVYHSIRVEKPKPNRVDCCCYLC